MTDEIQECRSMLVEACKGTYERSFTESGPTVLKWSDTVRAWAEKLSQLEGKQNIDRARKVC